MSDTPNLHDGEQILRQAKTLRYYSPGVRAMSLHGTVSLSNQRLIFTQPGFQQNYPLSHIVSVRSEKYGLSNALRVEFDTGAVYWYAALDDQPGWVDAILAAKADAPILAVEDIGTPIQEAVRIPGQPVKFMGIGIVLLLALACAVFAAVAVVIVAAMILIGLS